MEGSILWIFRLVRQVDQRLSTWRRLALQVNHRGQVPTDDWGLPLCTCPRRSFALHDSFLVHAGRSGIHCH